MIEETLSDKFKSLNITKKSTVKKDANYGNTVQPNNRAPYAKNIIAVTSGKGGVGKSTVSVNLAISLAKKGYKVGILDSDVYGPNIPRLTNTDAERIKWNDDNKIIPSENFGLKIMSVALTTPALDTPLVWRSSVAVSALMQFLEDVAWGELDFMVIDMPPGTGDIQITLAQKVPVTGAVIVTTPQDIALLDAKKGIEMFRKVNVPVLGVIENMALHICSNCNHAEPIFGAGGGERIAQEYQTELLGSLPLDITIRETTDSGKPSVAADADSTISLSYRAIARRLAANLWQHNLAASAGPEIVISED
jgi:ATP-binding protein involved in chromosome partitioning